MDDNHKKYRVDDFLQRKTSSKETIEFLDAMAFDPEFEQHIITEDRLNYDIEFHKDYQCFIPVNSMAADDGNNLCDLQCEAFLLKKHGRKMVEDKLVEEARKNYWLGDLGTPLYNIGRLLEKYGLVVIKQYDASIDFLIRSIENNDAIVVVNGNTLNGDSVSHLFSRNAPNHAVVVLAIDTVRQEVELFNPSTGNGKDNYSLERFLKAWAESQNFLVLIREPQYDYEFVPQPIDVSGVELSEGLQELSDFIAENAHNIWAEDKIRDNPGIRYAPLDEEGKEQPGCNHYLLPYSLLPDDDKKPDINMSQKTIKLLKRLGIRMVDVKKLHNCPECNEPIEKNFLYCPYCGRKLSWKDFCDN